MKTYAVLNQTTHHEDIRGGGGMACVLNLGARWRLRFMPQQLYSQGKRLPGNHLTGG